MILLGEKISFAFSSCFLKYLLGIFIFDVDRSDYILRSAAMGFTFGQLQHRRCCTKDRSIHQNRCKCILICAKCRKCFSSLQTHFVLHFAKNFWFQGKWLSICDHQNSNCPVRIGPNIFTFHELKNFLASILIDPIDITYFYLILQFFKFKLLS